MASAKSKRSLADYRSPKHKLLAFFKTRRDAWKAKCLARGKDLKRLRDRVADLAKSRDEWKQRAKAAEAELARIRKSGNHFQKTSALVPLAVSPAIVLTPTAAQAAPAYHHFPLSLIMLGVAFVAVAAISMRGSSAVLRLLAADGGQQASVPSFWTIRLWLQKIGLFKLNRPKPRAKDWAWMADHTMQIGAEKCFLVIGIRLADLPPRGQCLRHEDMEPLGLIPMKRSNGKTVVTELNKLAQRTGVPRQIVADEGSDLRAGIALFRQKHPETLHTYDIRHKAACLLKRSLGNDSRWAQFCQKAARTRKLLQQTDLAALAPPNQRSKARYMNVKPLTTWGNDVVAIQQSPKRKIFSEMSISKTVIRKHLGWVKEYTDDLVEWHEMATIAQSVDKYVQRNGLDNEAGRDMKKTLKGHAKTERGRRIETELLVFVEHEASKARPGERLVGSTTALESIFGKLKHLQGSHSGGGFTSLLLGAVARIGKTTQAVVGHALESIRVEDLHRWCQEKLGLSPRAKRHRILAATRGTKTSGKT